MRIERQNREPELVGDRIERPVPTCRLTETVGAVKQRASETGIELCPVVNEAGVVLGLCARTSLHARPMTPVEEVMKSGPMTIRPSMTVEAAVQMLDQYDKETILVTSSDGKLIGLFRRHRMEQVEAEAVGDSIYG
ncbi:MAG: CBS domain-containing protein [Deltaproteobacteria bacterium]|nr:CBS domain-containing protein [Deltaproteobacteria bacterium]